MAQDVIVIAIAFSFGAGVGAGLGYLYFRPALLKLKAWESAVAARIAKTKADAKVLAKDIL